MFVLKKIILVTLFTVTIVISHVQGQTIDEIIDGIYQQTIDQEARLDSLKDYSFIQKIHFTKLDGDGDIDEESRREFFVQIHSREVRHRELIAAYELEDGQWVNITEEEKNKSQSDSKSVKFSLTEIFSPEKRKEYEINLLEDGFSGQYETLHLEVIPLEEDEDKFRGDLWFEKDSYALLRAVLIPSELPIAVDDMIMDFSMKKYGDVWMPAEVKFEAAVSFLFFFKGKIISDILMDDYHFNQAVKDSVID